MRECKYGYYTMKFFDHDPEVKNKIVDELNAGAGQHGAIYQNPEDVYENTGNRVVFAIYDDNNSEWCGNISLNSIDWINRNCEISFLIATKYRGKKLGPKFGRFAVSHAVEILNMHRVYGGTLESNEPMISVFKELGFYPEGTLRESVWGPQGYESILLYGYCAQ